MSIDKFGSNEFVFSPDQKKVFDGINDWLYGDKKTPLRIGGYAGTGKTTLIGVVRKYIKERNDKVRVAFACPTGMASQNLNNKLLEQHALIPKDYIGTIHRLIYTPDVDTRGQIIAWTKNDEIKEKLIIVDEGSMVTRRVWQDLLSFGVPIIVFGDHGQLPPVGDDFNLMDKPDLRLEHIHRQAAENPIISLATLARNGEPISVKRYGVGIEKIDRTSYEAEEISNIFFNSRDTDSLILCGTNKLRNQLNSHIRESRDIVTTEPVLGDKVVCLKNIYTNKGGAVYNGMIGKIEHVNAHDKHKYHANIRFDEADVDYDGLISRKQFGESALISQIKGLKYTEIGDRFDYGYALTVHKAQGSQARRVLIFDESRYFRESAHKWLYTAITRAQEELYILGS